MASNAQRGAYWKARSKKWLQAHGYQVADMEVVRIVRTPDGLMVPTKRDQFGADLMGMNHDEVVFVQVKGGIKANVAGARREFEKHIFARGVRRCIHVWKPLAREPQVFECL